ncbi:hypothetical protein [Nostoc sp. PCC 7107]|uniref:hypothetical protein n=1 Tax=Nostoc sp. PCC 7107 TaxID=317936 RepID=UPI0005CACE0C|nr:hypothetical protein [Nostoc sp. PCC 7107]
MKQPAECRHLRGCATGEAKITKGDNFPMERVCKIAIAEVKKFFQQTSSLEQVIFVCFGQTAFDLYTKTMQEFAET